MKIWPTWNCKIKIVFGETISILQKETWNYLDLWDTIRSPNLGQMIWPIIYLPEERNSWILPGDYRVKIKRKDRQILGPCQRAEKAVEDESDVDTNCCSCLWTVLLRRGKYICVKHDSRRIRIIQTAVQLKSTGRLKTVLLAWGDLLS